MLAHHVLLPTVTVRWQHHVLRVGVLFACCLLEVLKWWPV